MVNVNDNIDAANVIRRTSESFRNVYSEYLKVPRMIPAIHNKVTTK